MIKYRKGYDIDYIRLVELFTEAGWEDKTTDYKRLFAMVENSTLVVTAWDFDYMVGFARLTCDEAYNGQINNVVVDNEYQNRGIGKELIRQILSYNPRITYLLRADRTNEDFYLSLGFEPAEHALIYKSKG